MRPTAPKAVGTYGGQERWVAAKVLEAKFSADGLAFRLKRCPPFRRAHIAMETRRPYARIISIGRDPEIAGVLDGAYLCLEHAGGQVLAERLNVYHRLPYGRHLFYRDDLDMA